DPAVDDGTGNLVQPVTTYVYTDGTGTTASLPKGLLLSVTDPMQRETQYTYDSRKLYQEIDPAVIDPATGNTVHPTTTYTYTDGTGETAALPKGLLLSET